MSTDAIELARDCVDPAQTVAFNLTAADIVTLSRAVLSLAAERDALHAKLERSLDTSERVDAERMAAEERIATLRAALAEAVNRWEWFAQRCTNRTGGIDAAEEHDYPRIATLRKIAEAKTRGDR